MKIFILIITTIFTSSCLKEDLSYEVYRSKKEISSTTQMSANAEGIQKENDSSLKWSAPQQWKEKETNSIRIGSYDLPSIGDKKAELSIIILAGDGGGITPNLNRWRGQIGLEQSDKKTIESTLEKITGKLGIFQFTQITNQDKSILAAFIMNKGKTIYVKATGHKDVLDNQRDLFLEFIKGIYESK
ncbi:hypothetical protein [Halobacteriovorax sp. HLS]|uniref:hypothetical protein n=1 Tax=Halobacteriovorax sp. HLS TaxID=2234000 RepID=UPI000FDBC4A4|nr:hypothetical protein [Halobacteriovorax sp. HLS]